MIVLPKLKTTRSYIFIHLDVTPERDGHTDRRTNRQLVLLQQYALRAMRTRCKNYIQQWSLRDTCLVLRCLETCYDLLSAHNTYALTWLISEHSLCVTLALHQAFIVSSLAQSRVRCRLTVCCASASGLRLEFSISSHFFMT